MKITEKTWLEYITRLSRMNEEAGKKMADYIAGHGTQDTDALIEYAAALVQKYGEGTAELACQMYDAMAEKAMEKNYEYDENGDILRDENGEPVEISKGGFSYGDGPMIEVYAIQLAHRM